MKALFTFLEEKKRSIVTMAIGFMVIILWAMSAFQPLVEANNCVLRMTC